MKIQVRAKSATTKTRNQKTSAPAKSKTERKFVKGVLDLTPFMIAKRVPRRTVIKDMRAAAMPKAEPSKRMFLIASGAKGVYVSEVKSEDGNFYSRVEPNGELRYGMVKSLPEIKGFAIEIVGAKTLVKRVSEHRKVLTVQNVQEKTDVTVALLNSFEDQVVAGVHRQDGKLHALTMHHVARYASPRVQFNKPRDVRNAAKFLATLAA